MQYSDEARVLAVELVEIAISSSRHIKTITLPNSIKSYEDLPSGIKDLVLITTSYLLSEYKIEKKQ